MSAFDQELVSTLDDIKKRLKVLESCSLDGQNLQTSMDKVQQTLKLCSSTLHHLQYEIRDTDDRQLADTLSKSAIEHDKTIKELKYRFTQFKFSSLPRLPNPQQVLNAKQVLVWYANEFHRKQLMAFVSKDDEVEKERIQLVKPAVPMPALTPACLLDGKERAREMARAIAARQLDFMNMACK